MQLVQQELQYPFTNYVPEYLIKISNLIVNYNFYNCPKCKCVLLSTLFSQLHHELSLYIGVGIDLS